MYILYVTNMGLFMFNMFEYYNIIYHDSFLLIFNELSKSIIKCNLSQNFGLFETKTTYLKLCQVHRFQEKLILV